jgi:hypothetical protein
MVWKKHLRLAIFWAVVGGLTVLAVLPYLRAVFPAVRNVPLAILCIAAVVQNVLILFVLNWVGLTLGATVGLDSPIAGAYIERASSRPVPLRTLAIAGISGLILGLAIIGLDSFIFWPSMPPTLAPVDFDVARWKCVLASFYGGIGEELFCRLFAMTVIVWLIWKFVLRSETRPQKIAFWTAIIGSTLLFAAGHLPAAAQIWHLTPSVIARVLTLNALPGVFFGLFYWNWGLEHAMITHFCADIVLHVVTGH